MVMCWAFGCNHYNNKHSCRFYRFPQDVGLRRKWLALLRRTVEPSKGARVCSCHFQDGSNDKLPEIFEFNVQKRFGQKYLSPELRKKRPQLKNKAQLSKVKKNFAEPSTSSSHLPSVIDMSPQIQQNIPEIRAHLSKPTALEAENFLLHLDLEKQQTKYEELKQGRFGYDQICDDDKLFSLYTGLPQRKIFDSVYTLLSTMEIKYKYKSKVEMISRRDQLLMTLMKLRQNFPHEDLAFRFKISRAAVSNIVITWIHVLYEILCMDFMNDIPSRNKNKSCLPNAFSTFTNCRIILDCTEVFIMVPRKSLSRQKSTYSSYKHRNTAKALVGVAPNGVITFISDLYPGSTSDKRIVEDSGLPKILSDGDLVIADKGFLIGDVLPPGVHYNIPPFLVLPQFTKAQVEQTETIARARIHIERAIRRIKYYKILNLIPHTLCKYADVIFKVIGALTNLHYPLIKEVENLYDE